MHEQGLTFSKQGFGKGSQKEEKTRESIKKLGAKKKPTNPAPKTMEIIEALAIMKKNKKIEIEFGKKKLFQRNEEQNRITKQRAVIIT